MKLSLIQKLKIKVGLIQLCQYCRCYPHSNNQEMCVTCDHNIELLGDRFKIKLATSAKDLKWFEPKGSENPVIPR